MTNPREVRTTLAVIGLILSVAACSGGQKADSCTSDTQCGAGICADQGCQSASLTSTSSALTVTPQAAQLEVVAGVAPTGVTFVIANPSSKGHGFAVVCDSDAQPSPEEGHLDPSASASVALELPASSPGTSAVTCAVTSRSGHTAYAKFVLTLKATGPGADFSVAVKPAALTLDPGKSGTSQVVIVRSGGFSSHVALAVSGVPAGATAIFGGSGGGDGDLQAASAGEGSGVSLLVNAGTAAPGSYTLSIDATSGALSHHAPIALTVGGTPPVAKPDFAVAASPGSLSATAGGAAATSSVSVIPANGFASPVTLTLAGLPAGATGSFDKATMPGGIGSATLTVQAKTSAAGKYPLTVTAAGGGLTHSAMVELTVANGAPAADFTLAAMPGALSLTDGGAAATTTVRVTPSNGFVRDVALILSGAPAGVKASLDTSTIYAGSGTATLSVQAINAAPGSFTLTVTASAGTSTHTASVALAVASAAPAPDFAVAASPASLSVTVGGVAATSSVSVVPANGFNSQVTLTLAGVPAGATGSFDKATLTGGSALLTLQAKTAAPGKYPLTVTAVGGGLTHSATVDLTIGTVVPAADFTLAATPGALSLTDGGAAATTTVRVTPSNGFVRDVSLIVSGVPAGAKATLNTSTIYAGSGTATLSVQAMTAAAGSFTLTITASGGTSTHTASVALAIAAAAPPPDFAVSASPTSLQVNAGASGTSLVSVSPMNGFMASVMLSVAGVPSGAAASFATPTLATGSGTDMLTMSSGTAGAGTYPLTVTASGGGVSHTSSISLTIAAVAACTPDTWVNFAQAFMANNCLGCHSYAASVATLKPHPNATWISNGSMPPGGALSASDKSRILQWLSCGLP